MEKLSRAAKYKEYRNELLNSNEQSIATDELKGLQQRVIEVEKKFGNTSKTELDMNRGYKSSTAYGNVYDGFANQNYVMQQSVYPQQSQMQQNVYNQPMQQPYVQPQQQYIQPQPQVMPQQFAQPQQYINPPQPQQPYVQPAPNVGPIVNNQGDVFRSVGVENKENHVDNINVATENSTNAEVSQPASNVSEQLNTNLNSDVELLLKDILSKQNKDDKNDSYLKQIKQILSIDDEKSNNESIDGLNESQNGKENEGPSVKDQLSKIFVEEEPEAPTFIDPEYVPTPQSDTDSIPSVESLIDEINSVVIENEEPKKEETVQEEPQIIPVVEKKEIAEFVEPKVEEKIEFESTLRDVVIEKPVIKPVIPQVDNSKEFSELCENVNKLAQEIEITASFGDSQYVPPRPIIPPIKLDNPSLDSLKDNIQNEINSDPEMNSFMDNLKKEVKVYNQSVSNATIDEIKDNIVDDQRHKSEEKTEKVEEKSELKQKFESTVSTEVNKLLNEINSSKTDVISADDVIKNSDTIVTDISDLRRGKTIAFESDDLKSKNVHDNTIVLKEPYKDNENIDDSSIHTMSFETEELYEDEEKSSTLLNIILSVLIILAVAALGVIAYFFLLTRGII